MLRHSLSSGCLSQHQAFLLLKQPSPQSDKKVTNGSCIHRNFNFDDKKNLALFLRFQTLYAVAEHYASSSMLHTM